MNHYHAPGSIGDAEPNVGNWMFDVLNALPNGGSFAEVGTYIGSTAASISKLLIPKGWTITCVDIVRRPEWDETMRAHNLHNSVKFVKDCSWDAPRTINEKFDVVFIDADHEYLSVKNDIKAWLPYVKDGGILMGDDYNFNGVRKAVDELIDFEHYNIYGRIWISKVIGGKCYRYFK